MEKEYEKQSKTEKKILQAASKVFMRKGKAGTSLQDIADEAGINRTLLHYYFRSKNRLFDSIFTETLKRVLPALVSTFNADILFLAKVEQVSRIYIDILKENPYIPIFVFQEISSNPERLVRMVRKRGLKPDRIIDQVEAEIRKLKGKPYDPRHLIINFLSMVVFPFIARPLLQEIAFTGDEQKYVEFLEERKKLIPEFIRMAITHQEI